MSAYAIIDGAGEVYCSLEPNKGSVMVYFVDAKTKSMIGKHIEALR